MTNQAAHVADEALPTEITFDEPRYPGLRDLYRGICNFPLWSMLGWSDIRQRYRRSALGPFWITLSTALFIALLGVIYSRIFNQDIATYLPYIAVGLICWGFISGTTIESCVVYIEGTAVIKQMRLPYSIYPLRMIWRSFIVILRRAIPTHAIPGNRSP